MPVEPLASAAACSYVLEQYASLSWLTMDPVLNDRRCCLPPSHLLLAQTLVGLETFTGPLDLLPLDLQHAASGAASASGSCSTQAASSG